MKINQEKNSKHISSSQGISEIPVNKFKESIIKSLKGIINTLPIMIGIILLISLAQNLIPTKSYSTIFSGSYFDVIIGNLFGSIMASNALNSYIIGGELLKQNISIIPITAFIVSWSTVGLVQLPAESMLLGKKFTIVRNIVAFIFSILVAIITYIGVNLI